MVLLFVLLLPDIPPVSDTPTEGTTTQPLVTHNTTSSDVCSMSSAEVSSTSPIPVKEDLKESSEKVSKDETTKKPDDGRKKKKQQVVLEKENLCKFRREKRIRSPKEMVTGTKVILTIMFMVYC